MTAKQVHKMFKSQLGESLLILYTTADNKIFIELKDAHNHVLGKCYIQFNKPLKDQTILVWTNNLDKLPTKEIV
jgi:hypothetical protein